MSVVSLSKAFYRAENSARSTRITDAEELAFNQYGVKPGDEVFLWRPKPPATQRLSYLKLVPGYDGTTASNRKLRRRLSRMEPRERKEFSWYPTLAVVVSIDAAFWNQNETVTAVLTVAPLLAAGLGKTRRGFIAGELGSVLTNVSRR